MINVCKACWYEDRQYIGDAKHQYPCVLIRELPEGNRRPIRIKVHEGKYKGVYSCSFRTYYKAPIRYHMKRIRIDDMTKEKE